MPITRALSFFLALVALAQPTLAQSTSDDVLRNLLAEVRALRLTLQRSSLLSLRGDLLVERIRTAQNRVATTQDSIDDIRAQLASIEQEETRFRAEIENVEDKIRREYDAEAAALLQQELEQYKSYATSLSNQAGTLRRTESELLLRLDEARARLDGLEAEFDDLLREIERQLQNPE